MTRKRAELSVDCTFSLRHKFYLIRTSRVSGLKPSELPDVVKLEPVAHIEDVVLSKMGMTLLWVSHKTFRYLRCDDGEGLNYTACTVLVGSEAARFSRILDAWCALFSDAPAIVRIPSGYDPEAKVNTYDAFDRDRIIEGLTSTSRMARAASEEEDSCLLHMGV